MVRSVSRSVAGAAALLLACAALLVPPSTAAADPVVETLSFIPVADTYVRSGAPTTSYGTSSSLYVDSKEAKESFLKFNIEGVDGYEVTAVRLKLFQKDASPQGGRAFLLPGNSWTEAMTWDTRPTGYKGAGPLDTVGTVQKAQWYTFRLGPIVESDGLLSIALDSTNSDGSVWASLQSATDPILEVDYRTDDSTILDGVSQVAPATVGSSDPTYYGTNHRLVVTEAGRLLAIHGRHSTGVQLAWRNPWGQWQTKTSGSVTDGILLGGTRTGDWSASIALADDSSGEQHAWVVWAGPTSSTTKPLEMRRLSNLDSPSGPTVGPKVTIAPPGVSGETGNSKADIAFEAKPGGGHRGLITWLQRTASNSYQYSYTWFTDLDADQPTFHDTGALFTNPTGGLQGTLTDTPEGIAWVGRKTTVMRVYRHDAGDELTDWPVTPPAGIGIGSASFPSATTLSNGDVLAAVESDTGAHVVKVQRFPSIGAPGVAQAFSGYRHPTIATDGEHAWVVMIRQSDGSVVSRHFNGTTWSGTDTVEIQDSNNSATHNWPNAVRTTDGRLRFIVEGASGGPAQNAVLAFQRPLS